jgi:hypothetical protein
LPSASSSAIEVHHNYSTTRFSEGIRDDGGSVGDGGEGGRGFENYGDSGDDSVVYFLSSTSRESSTVTAHHESYPLHSSTGGHMTGSFSAAASGTGMAMALPTGVGACVGSASALIARPSVITPTVKPLGSSSYRKLIRSILGPLAPGAKGLSGGASSGSRLKRLRPVKATLPMLIPMPCSNPLCRSRRSAQWHLDDGWQMCPVATCYVQFCMEEECRDILKKHIVICSSISRS